MRNMQIGSEKLQASFTIEAAVVVPLAMIMMATVIFAAFYVHNAATIAAVTDYAVLEQAAGMNGSQNVLCQGVKELLAGRLIGETAVSVSISGGEENGTAYTSASFQIPLAMIRELMGNTGEKLSFQTEVSNLNGRKKLLLYKSICDGVSELLTVD